MRPRGHCTPHHPAGLSSHWWLGCRGGVWGERLGLKQGDVVVITIEARRVILEKRASSPVDASFGLWTHLPLGPAYIDALRDEWDTRLTERLPDA